MPLITRDFFLRPNVVQIARDLLGKHIITRINGTITSGIICETEAYAGVTDKASHAFGGRRTARTEVMYACGGTAYVYLCYGVHSLFNIVTNSAGIPDAVLIRGIIPFYGTETMLKRSGTEKITKHFGIGPGNVSKLLGIHYSNSGLDLTNIAANPETPAIWLEANDTLLNPDMIHASQRIGVDYAGEDARLPYRFQINGSYTQKGINHTF